MKKTTKILLVLLAVGIAGVAITMGVAISTDMLMSREDTQVYAVSEPFDKLELSANAPVELLVAEQASIEVFAKAWLPQPINVQAFVDVRVHNGVLKIDEVPPAPKFFGFFPQPYELKITLRLPQHTYDTVTGGQK